jgi:hypothetical protein
MAGEAQQSASCVVASQEEHEGLCCDIVHMQFCRDMGKGSVTVYQATLGADILLRQCPSLQKNVTDMTIAVFRRVTPSILLDRYQPLGEMCYFKFHDRKALYSHTLKLESASPVERVVTICQATRCHIPEVAVSIITAL